jgi:acyl-CoA synthetase (AMP-forming)/AMP-acid ligase II
MLTQQLLETRASDHAEELALVVGEQRITHRGLDTDANRLAHALRDHGVQRGDRVAILLDNSSHVVTAIFECLKVGAIVTVFHQLSKPEKIGALLRNAEPASLVRDSEHARDSQDGLAATRALRCVVWADDKPLLLDSLMQSICGREVSAYPSQRPKCQSIDADLASLIYTSGPCGEPQG